MHKIIDRFFGLLQLPPEKVHQHMDEGHDLVFVHHQDVDQSCDGPNQQEDGASRSRDAQEGRAHTRQHWADDCHQHAHDAAATTRCSCCATGSGTTTTQELCKHGADATTTCPASAAADAPQRACAA